MDGEPAFDPEKAFEISEASCEWTVRAMTVLKTRLKVNIKLHHRDNLIRDGHIFLFNHFARFETFIPQYLIYLETGAFCRFIAAKEFFKDDDRFGKYLRSLGGIPNDYERILPFLAEEILRGRKVIVFPEGGMVKDRRVLDRTGSYSVYSRSSRERRKHHAGAAVLALTLSAFKAGVKEIDKSGNTNELERWAGILNMESVDALRNAIHESTTVVPSNITFYPLRVGENILKRGVEILSRQMSPKIAEELLIEGNILLKHTDMDIRLGDAVKPAKRWRWWERRILGRMICRIDSIDELFARDTLHKRWTDRLVYLFVRRQIFSLRDAYMREMYANVTINLSHLTSGLIMLLLKKGEREVDAETFHKTLYIATKYIQKKPSVFLHRSLRNPEAYVGVLDGKSEGLNQFMSSKACKDLISFADGKYRFLPSLREEHSFDEIRLENLIAVYANEMAPIKEANQALADALNKAPTMKKKKLALYRFDDELTSYAWQKNYFSKPRYKNINDQETATESGEPFLLQPNKSNDLGVVLVHGFLASPAEMRGFGERLCAAGHPVIGVRLNGHGTSPWDLRGRTWQNWQEPVRRGYDIMSGFCERICLAGFSSGGALSLMFASEQPPGLAGVVAIATPVKFRNKALIFVPLVHGANKLAQWLPSFEGVLPFRKNKSEHPQINYGNMAIRSLYELHRMVDALQDRLPSISSPVFLVQGSEDAVVDPVSAEIIMKRLTTANKDLVTVASKRHGILNEDIGNTQEIVHSFITSLMAVPLIIKDAVMDVPD
ncbi:MAG: alpha/beta fold hydrolase [Gammaproteobacteria bacterium]|nr:alpha/beta fold hydrolase [Gammaproteobacteria bacterium]